MFKISVHTEGNFMIEAWLREHTEDAHISRSNGHIIICWATVDQIEQVTDWGYSVRVY